jgi:hypothetical protein
VDGFPIKSGMTGKEILVEKVSNTSEIKSHTVLICCCDDLLITYRTTRLDNGFNTRTRRRIDRITKREERFGSKS